MSSSFSYDLDVPNDILLFLGAELLYDSLRPSERKEECKKVTTYENEEIIKNTV